MARHSKLNEVSGRVMDYLIERRGFTQSEIAAALGVDKSFVSRVRARERDLSPTHLDRLAEALGVDLGVMMVDVARPRQLNHSSMTPERRQVFELCASLIEQASKTYEAGRLATRASQ